MKKYSLSAFALILGLVLVSWGPVGHETVAKIAENHLTSKTRLAVERLLDGQTMPQVSNYADEMRSDATAGLHFIDLPGGLDFDTFVKTIMEMKTSNAYSAIIHLERELANPATSKEEKAVDLKYMIHIVGDIHQPMHVSHTKDRGGTNIYVTFNGKPYNLHGLWDSGLIAENNLNYIQLAKTVDNATSVQIKQWQSDAPITWAWESYQLSEQLYAEAAKNPNFNTVYYRKYMPVIRQRLLQGGIRLAGLLNQIFDPANN
jgi:hypothetical protein